MPTILKKKPIGLITRGKTADNRLRRVDYFALMYDSALLTRRDGEFADALFVDLGYGFDPRTTLESAARFRRVNPALKILGVEIDSERVESALPFSDEKTFFRLGGFNLPVLKNERVRLIRAFNVLRQYEEKDFAPAYQTLAPYVLHGGLMIEGTSNPFGSIWTANVARKTLESDGLPSKIQQQAAGVQNLESDGFPSRVQSLGSWKMEALVFSTNFHTGFDVEEFQTILPKNYIHRMRRGEEIYDFFEAWKKSAAETSHVKAFGLKQWFGAAAESLAAKGYKIDLHKKWLNKGWLIWKKESL